MQGISAQPAGQAFTFQEEYPLTYYDSIMLAGLPELAALPVFQRTDLPFSVDNSVYPYFREIYQQVSSECGQVSGIGYNFTYEMDRLRDLPASDPENQYPPHFTFNFMNGGYGWHGVSYFHSFEILRKLGCPTVATYGGMAAGGDIRWMNGYDNYYLAMKNRIREVYQIKVGTPEGLMTLKHWLHNHLDGSAIGGVASFYANSPWNLSTLPEGTPEANKHVIIKWGGLPSHAMTIVGYNDSIRYDYNADGFDDLVVGGGKHRHCLREAFVYFGGSEIGPGPDIVLSMPCTQCGIAFAEPITPCGDINADGFDDFTLGDPNNGPGYSLIYYGGTNADSLKDNILLNPDITGMGYGRTTMRTKGDYDGDGYPDLVQYSYFPKTIYIYKGGPDFDNAYDYSIYDSTFPTGFSCFEYIDRITETGASDLAISYWSGDNYSYLIYPGGPVQCHSPNFVLKNNLNRSGITIASGDFNNDGITDIFAGIPYENNWGCYGGGVVNYYQLFATVSIEDETTTCPQPVSIFPNPTSSMLNVELSINKTGPAAFKLFDIKGKLYHHETRDINRTGVHKIHINLEGFSPGVYILEIQQGSFVIREKLILAQ